MVQSLVADRRARLVVECGDPTMAANEDEPLPSQHSFVFSLLPLVAGLCKKEQSNERAREVGSISVG